MRRASISGSARRRSRRMVVRQRLGVHRQGHTRHRNGLGPEFCFTPVRSPEFNGIAEAFVKTFKRDYARLSILPDAETLIALLPAWFEDYNEVHPHSGLKFLSPREFLRLCLAQPATCPVKRGAHHRQATGEARLQTGRRALCDLFTSPFRSCWRNVLLPECRTRRSAR